MEFYWVNLGTTHKAVVDQHFLWAPLSPIGDNGKVVTRVHWDNVGHVKKGDLIRGKLRGPQKFVDRTGCRSCHDSRLSNLIFSNATYFVTRSQPVRTASLNFSQLDCACLLSQLLRSSGSTSSQGLSL